ncbi:MAG: helix-turn-helix domain-containing protein [Henriciella sp.]
MSGFNEQELKVFHRRMRKQTRYSIAEFAKLKVPILEIKPFTRDVKAGEIKLDVWTAHGCSFGDSTIHAAIANRRARNSSGVAGEFFALHRYSGGNSVGYFDDQPVIRQAGHIYLIDLDLAWEGIREPGRLETIYIPKTAIGYETGTHPGFLEIAPETTLGRCLESHFDDLFETYRGCEEEELAPILEEVFACMKVAIGAPPRRGDVRTHLKAAIHRSICDFIEANLESRTLSTSVLLDHFGVSRASLYRMFQPYGGVRNYITERRALRAVFDLANGSGERGQIQFVSKKWGFASAMDFNRTINRLYGSAPGALYRLIPKELSGAKA